MFLTSMLLIEYSGQVASKAAMLGAGAGAELEHMARQDTSYSNMDGCRFIDVKTE